MGNYEFPSSNDWLQVTLIHGWAFTNPCRATLVNSFPVPQLLRKGNCQFSVLWMGIWALTLGAKLSRVWKSIYIFELSPWQLDLNPWDATPGCGMRKFRELVLKCPCRPRSPKTLGSIHRLYSRTKTNYLWRVIRELLQDNWSRNGKSEVK